MNLLRRLDETHPGWRDEISSDPIVAAIELGLLEHDGKDTPGELDFHDEKANWQRYLESEEDPE